MGASESIPNQLSHEKLYDLTKDTRYIMGLILEYMLKDITVRDFMALSNPEQCKKYVVFMSSTLYKYFYELQIQPIKDKKGIIAFRSFKDLANQMFDDTEKQSLCLQLSYFYTRIFQIYGALALTLIDDITYTHRTGIIPSENEAKTRLLTPGIKPSFYGGDILDVELGDFPFLKSYLYDSKDKDIGYRTKFNEKDPVKQIFFRLDTSSSSDPNAIRTTDNGIFTYYIKNSDKYAYLRVSVTTSTSTGKKIYKLNHVNIKYTKKKDSTSKVVTIPTTYQPSLLATFNETITNGKKEYSLSGTSSEYSTSSYLSLILYKIGYFINELILHDKILDEYKPSSNKDGYNTIIDSVTGLPLSNTKTKGLATIITPIVATEEPGVIEHLRLAKITHNLQVEKPFGHCIARGLQLLRNMPLKGETSTISFVCKEEFYPKKEKDGVPKLSRLGLPRKEQAITESRGLLALSFLFYDFISIGSPKLSINEKKGPSGKSTLDHYVEFMKRMATLFGNNKRGGDTGELKDATDYTKDIRDNKGLESIINMRDSTLCNKIQDKDSKGDIVISLQTAQQVYPYVQSLFKQQIKHSAECGKIFNMLFDIQRDPRFGRVRITLSKNIMTKGFPEIERINYLARQLLINYYTNCENTYLQGMQIVLNSKIREKHEKERQAKLTEEQKQAEAAAQAQAAKIQAAKAQAAKAQAEAQSQAEAKAKKEQIETTQKQIQREVDFVKAHAAKSQPQAQTVPITMRRPEIMSNPVAAAKPAATNTTAAKPSAAVKPSAAAKGK
jgi:hypothetical protein